MTEEEARKKGLPQSDTYKRASHLAYKDDMNRDHFVASLNEEAYKIFTDTILIKHADNLILESKQNFGAPMPYSFLRAQNETLENFKLAAAFEIHLKACLYQNDIVIHEILEEGVFEQLLKDQRKRPINKSELFDIVGIENAFIYEPYNSKRSWEGAGIVFDGLSGNTITFNKILQKSKYKKELRKSKDLLNIAADYLTLRNHIHLPGDAEYVRYVPTMEVGQRLIDHIRLVVNFINEDIVKQVNGYRQANETWNTDRLPIIAV